VQLTSEQKTIIELNSGQHLVLAPPGTGKTELLVQRLSKAVKKGIKQGDMICLTFTNRAALNMVDRVKSDIGEHDIFIGNIHSFCNTFLRRDNLIPQNTSLLDEEDVQLLLNDIKQTNSPCMVIDKYKSRAREINSNELLSYNTFIKQTKYNFPNSIIKDVSITFYSLENEECAKELCTKYEAIKEESNFIDFDDLLTLTYHHLSQENAKKMEYKWLQIDEVQDLNPLQWAIINKISNREESHRVFFGDYEQAIFSFMGAKLEILDKVASQSTVHRLQNNFRSPKYLLDLYVEYAKKNLNPKWDNIPQSGVNIEKNDSSLVFKKVTTHTEGKGYSTIKDEVKWIVKNYLNPNIKESTAILVRDNNTADLFAKKLHLNNINYFKVSGFDLFRRKEIKDLMAFLSVINNDDDRNAWIRTFHVYAKTKSLSESRNIINNLFKLGIKPLDILDDLSKPFLDNYLDLFQHGRVIVFDTETTGLDTTDDDIIQIAAIEVVNGIVGDTFEVFIDTDKDLSDSEKIHHISKEFLKTNSIKRVDALNNFIDFIGNSTLIAHNLNYDYEILNSNLRKSNLKTLEEKINMYDSIEIAKRVYPNLPSYKLEFLLNHLDIEGVNSHNALDDVQATVNVLLSLNTDIKKYTKERTQIIDRYKIYFNNFQNRFKPIYEMLKSNFSIELPLNEIVDMIFGYMENELNHKIEDDIYDELEKLTKHMKSKCTLDKSLLTIKKYIPEYAKYKESDLIIGDEKIIIATIHKAKGLEFDNVIIPGCTDDNFPNYFSKQSGKKAVIEDARLLYVAMTRTKKQLLITSHTMKIIQTSRGLWEIAQKPSRFLKPVLHFFNTSYKNKGG
jgi:DNA helicase-2/ATP-dependent DNA helicase PcrA